MNIISSLGYLSVCEVIATLGKTFQTLDFLKSLFIFLLETIILVKITFT